MTTNSIAESALPQVDVITDDDKIRILVGGQISADILWSVIKDNILSQIETGGGITLHASATALLGLSLQQISVNVQGANKIFAGPTVAGFAIPTFRELVSADLPPVADGSVTLAKLASIASQTFIGRNTSGVGAPEVLSLATALGMLNVASFDNPVFTGLLTTPNIKISALVGALNRLLYVGTDGAVGAIAGTASGALVTSAGGVPSIATDLPTGMTIGTKYIYRQAGTDIPVADGGTGLSAIAAGSILIANSANVLSVLTSGADTKFLRNTAGTISWEALALTGSDIAGAGLTKVDDTNVTLTLGGLPSTALLRAASLTLGWAGLLAVGRGGTGLATLAAGYLPKGNGASAMSASILYDSGTRIAIGTATPQALLHLESAADTGVSLYLAATAAAATTMAAIMLGATNVPATTSGGMFYTKASYTPSGVLQPNSLIVDCLDVGGLWIGARNAVGKIHFYTGGLAAGNERVTILETGYVGIAKVLPVYPLDVAGMVGASGAYVLSAANTTIHKPGIVYTEDYWGSAVVHKNVSATRIRSGAFYVEHVDEDVTAYIPDDPLTPTVNEAEHFNGAGAMIQSWSKLGPNNVGLEESSKDITGAWLIAATRTRINRPDVGASGVLGMSMQFGYGCATNEFEAINPAYPASSAQATQLCAVLAFIEPQVGHGTGNSAVINGTTLYYNYDVIASVNCGPFDARSGLLVVCQGTGRFQSGIDISNAAITPTGQVILFPYNVARGLNLNSCGVINGGPCSFTSMTISSIALFLSTVTVNGLLSASSLNTNAISCTSLNAGYGALSGGAVNCSSIACSGNLVHNNNTGVYGKNTGGTLRNLITMTSGNSVEIATLCDNLITIGWSAAVANPLYIHVGGVNRNVQSVFISGVGNVLIGV